MSEVCYRAWREVGDGLVRAIIAREEAALLSHSEQRDMERENHYDEHGGLRKEYEKHQQEMIRVMCEREDREMTIGGTVVKNEPGPNIIGPTRASTFPHDAKGRKRHPVASGVLDYFPDAIVAIAAVSFAGNEQHNPGQPLHWARNKSGDEWDALMRHFLERGRMDSDGIRHSAKLAWRALAALQKEIESEQPLKTREQLEYEANRPARATSPIDDAMKAIRRDSEGGTPDERYTS